MFDALSLPKLTQDLLNPVDSLADYVNTVWPELRQINNVWLTGGQVWRRLYNADVNEAKDVDLVITGVDKGETSAEVRTFLESLCACVCDGLGCSCLASDAGPSIGALGGEVYFTRRGRVDLWLDTNVRATLRRYSDAKSHVRVAFNTKSLKLVWLPSKVERCKGEKYITMEPNGGVLVEGAEWTPTFRLNWAVSE